MSLGVRGVRRVARPLRARRPEGDEGVSTVELALYAPLLMAVTFLVIQVALAYLANEAASSAAREAARVARIEGGTPQALADGQAKGEQIVTTIAGNTLQGGRVSVTRTAAGDVSVTVTGTARRVIPVPFVSFTVSQKVVGPVEQFRPAQ